MEKIRLEDKGAFTRISEKTAKDVEAASTEIPSEIHVSMPTGTREFIIENTFLLRVKSPDSFVLTQKPHDGSYEEFLQLARAKMDELLSQNDQILILEGP